MIQILCGDAHFATFPPDLIVPCVKAGTSERGCCPECGKAWVRVVEKTADNGGYPNGPGGDKRNHIVGQLPHRGTLSDVARWKSETLGFRPSCDHGGEPVPCRVLDPFGGACTTALVADRLGRDATMIELNPSYVAMGAARLRADCPMFTRVEVTP